MSVRHLEGYTYEQIPNYAKGSCARCGYGPNCGCQARPDTRRKKGMPGVILCGSCWEDTPAVELAEFIDFCLLQRKETP